MAKPSEPHQGEPVALPARMSDLDRFNNPLTDRWNACLDEIAKLGPLYTHADPGEVERLRGAVNEWEAKWQQEAAQVGLLRAQLAELLAAVSEHRKALKPLGLPLGDRLEEAAISASAEPPLSHYPQES